MVPCNEHMNQNVCNTILGDCAFIAYPIKESLKRTQTRRENKDEGRFGTGLLKHLLQVHGASGHKLGSQQFVDKQPDGTSQLVGTHDLD